MHPLPEPGHVVHVRMRRWLVEQVEPRGQEDDASLVQLAAGPRARPMAPAWVTDIRDQCTAAGVPFFFKQWGGTNKKRAGRRTWGEMPVGGRVLAGRPVQAIPSPW